MTMRGVAVRYDSKTCSYESSDDTVGVGTSRVGTSRGYPSPDRAA